MLDQAAGARELLETVRSGPSWCHKRLFRLSLNKAAVAIVGDVGWVPCQVPSNVCKVHLGNHFLNMEKTTKGLYGTNNWF